MVQKLPWPLKVPSKQRNRILSLSVRRILSLDPSVSCRWYRRHKTLWRQWWICPTSPSHLLWNLITVRGSVTAKIFNYKIRIFKKLLIRRFHPEFLNTTNHRTPNKQVSVDATGYSEQQHQHCFVCSFLVTDSNLHITLH